MSGFESVVGDMTGGAGEVIVYTDPVGLVHVRAIYTEGEQDSGATCKPLLQVQSEGSRRVSRAIKQRPRGRKGDE
jgi:hypothetical protein